MSAVDVLAVLDALVESTARVADGETVTADVHTVGVAKRTRAAVAELIREAQAVADGTTSDLHYLRAALARVTGEGA